MWSYNRVQILIGMLYCYHGSQPGHSRAPGMWSPVPLIQTPGYTAGCPIRRTFFSEIWLSEILDIKWRSPRNIDGHILLWGGSFWIFRFWHVWGLLDQINCFRESYNHCLKCPPQLLARCNTQGQSGDAPAAWKW